MVGCATFLANRASEHGTIATARAGLEVNVTDHQGLALTVLCGAGGLMTGVQDRPGLCQVREAFMVLLLPCILALQHTSVLVLPAQCASAQQS